MSYQHHQRVATENLLPCYGASNPITSMQALKQFPLEEYDTLSDTILKKFIRTSNQTSESFPNNIMKSSALCYHLLITEVKHCDDPLTPDLYPLEADCFCSLELKGI